jgi:hypothetical protein
VPFAPLSSADTRRAEQALAGALAATIDRAVDGVDEVVVAAAAAQIIATDRVLGDAAQRRILGGARTDGIVPTALAETGAAYDLLARAA